MVAAHTVRTAIDQLESPMNAHINSSGRTTSKFAKCARPAPRRAGRSGVAENRHPELEHGIRQAFAASTCATIDEFYDLIEAPQAGAVEMDLLVNSVTVSETHFFRDEAQFDAIYNKVLPQIIRRKNVLRTLRIWSAGCASGEEPYQQPAKGAEDRVEGDAHWIGHDHFEF